MLFVLNASWSWAQISLEKKDESCAGKKDGRIDVLFEGTLPNAKYTWTKDGQPFSGGKSVSGLAPGNYSVTVTADGGCMAFKSAKIWPGGEVNVDISARLLNVSPRPVPCGTYPEFTYKLTAIPSGGKPPYYCSWGSQDPGNGECSITISGTSIAVSVFMSDSLGCGDSDGWQKKSVKKICARDPNDIAGPDGYDTLHWMSVHDELEYHVRFENDPVFATANAAVVLITLPIDDDINPFSFRLGSIGFGNVIVEIPENTSSYQQRLDYSENLGFMVDVTAGLDIPNNRFFWLMETIDPLTGQPPTDPEAGFLPVNDTLTGSGEGFINFTCMPKSTTLTGETVEHQASIIFDANDPLLTNTWSNKIDAFPPSTELNNLPDTFTTNLIPIAWLIEDDPGGCGVKQGEVLLSNDKIAFQTQGLLTDSTHTTLTLNWAQKYYYRVRGTDHVNNEELPLTDSFYILPQREIQFFTPDQEVYCIADTLWIDAALISLVDADLYVSIDSGMTYTLLENGLNAWPYAIPLDSLYVNKDVLVKLRNDASGVEAISSLFTVHMLPLVLAEADPDEGCIDDILFVQGFGANTYSWGPDTIIGTPESRYSNVYANVSQYAWVTGTNTDGCSAIDSVWLTIYAGSKDTLAQSLCEGDSIWLNGQWISEEGFFPNTYADAHGCDSVIVTEVFFEYPCIWAGGIKVYVDKDATGNNNGTSWEDAFNELRDAVYVAGRYENVQEIWVAEGVYHPHPTYRDTSFILRDSIKIYGGFLGFETELGERTADPELVQLSGDINIQDTLWDNSYHTVIFSQTCTECIVDGVTITYGHADHASNPDNIGAGVLNQGVGHFRNVIFERNYATDQGGALHSSGSGANLIIEDCIFRLNTSSLGKDIVNLSGAQIEFRGANGIH